MARVLFLTELLPYPLVSGAKIRAYYTLRYLAQRHEVTLVSFVRDDDTPEHVAHMEGFLTQVHTVPIERSWLRNARAMLISLGTGLPAIIAREEIAAMDRQVHDLLGTGSYEIVHADQIPMARYGLLARDRGAKRLLDQHNATFQVVERLAHLEENVWKRLFLQREARAFARYEADVCRRFDHVTFVSKEDRRVLMDKMPDPDWDQRSSVIPICVDTAKTPVVPAVSESFRVTYVGTMYWPPNVEGFGWFHDRVWPLVREKVPRACLTCIGKNPPERIRSLDGRLDVEITGYVEDLSPYLAETAVFIVPLHAAGGMRVKIVDAWCWGLPVVSTTIGAEGISLEPGQNILIADEPDAFARAVVQVLIDRTTQARLRLEGRRWVEARYDWRRVYPAWDHVYDRLLGA